ncbi:MAG: M48 family metallopeptidase [Lachnospiraceae bacterium]|nr:M48 family metallopeptidase [Lachnospiraceae bacterium]
MKILTINGTQITYTLTKSRRKSLAICIKPDSSIHIRAPFFVSQREIEGFIHDKYDWIIKTIDRISQRRKQHESQRENQVERKFITGETLPFLGRDYTLIVTEVNKKRSKIQINELTKEIYLAFGCTDCRSLDIYDNIPIKLKQAAIESWYRSQARELIHEKAAYFAQILNVSYHDIRIKDQKTLWGSCSSKGNLNFNWRIVFAPEEVLEYLVIHELCHLSFMNHSADFWQCVESIQPNYKQVRRWLKENSAVLRRDLNVI